MTRLSVILGFVCAFAAATIQAATFTVANTAETGAGSLAQAILDANANGSGVTDVIAFNIPGAGVQTITLTGPLPAVTTPVLIDGYTQPGSSANTLTFDNGDNAVILIRVDGSNFGTLGMELQAGASGSTVRGLDMTRFGSALALASTTGVRVDGNFFRNNGNGVYVSGTSSGNFIGDAPPAQRNLFNGNQVGIYFQSDTTGNTLGYNYIGTDLAGTAPVPNLTGVWVEGIGNRIIGNLISGHTSFPDATGILVTNAAQNIEVYGNRIGTQANGVGSIPNNYGILFTGGGGESPSGTLIGAAGAGNVIANSLLDGIAVRSLTPPSTGHRILYNTFRTNAGLAIDLEDDGVTANDPLDADAGANLRQNYPVITSATRSAGGAAIVSGTLSSAPGTQYTVQLLFNIGCNASGFGEGGFVTETTVTTNAAGSAAFSFSLPSLPNGSVSTTATDPAGNTSELSQCVALVTEDPQLAISGATQAEGNAGTSLMNFTVTLTPASQFPVTVTVQTANVTASAGSDYVAANTVLTFNPGQTARTFSVTINGDTALEPDETFTAALSGATNASIATPVATGTITNDDATAPVIEPIPTAGTWALIAIGMMVACVALFRLRM